MKSCHFFKIILDSAIQDGKLGIPISFLRKYGKYLSTPVFLKVPNGAVWQVDLMKHDDKVWLQNGWPEFVKFYSIAYGHLIVFRYDGNSHFHVLIFDKSASEIEYPSNTTSPKTKKIESDVFVEILNERPYKKSRTNAISKIGNTSKPQSLAPCMQSKGIQTRGMMRCAKSKTDVDSRCSLKEFGEGSTGVMPTRCWRSEVLRRMQAVSANERAKAFKPQNPFFMITMRPSYVGRRLSIPASFASKYNFEKHKNVILQASDGRSWLVEYYFKAYGAKKISQLHCGWKAFVQANNLKVGDVCVFELVNVTEISLEVVIFRVAEGANCCLPLQK